MNQNLAEQYAGLELIKAESCYQIPSLYYWYREAKSSNAEVDYIIQIGQEIVPIEVKAETKGSMQSMYLFMQEKRLSKGIRIASENFSAYGNIEVCPLYAIENLRSG